MTNLTNIFSDGIRFSDGYNHYEIIKQINRLEGIFSDLDDKGANWDIIWSLKGKISQVYAFFQKGILWLWSRRTAQNLLCIC